MPVSESYTAGDQLLASQVVTIAKAINRGFFAGMIQDFFGLEADVPNGWLLCTGGTIGNGSSGGTLRANADMETLFSLLWSVGNTDGTLAIFDSAGAGSTFGANAAADFAANKRLAVPDFRGRTAVANDDMGGSDAGRIVANDTQSEKVGGSAGAETINIAHTHTVPGTGNITDNGSGKFMLGSNPTATSSSLSSSQDIMQPTMFLNKIIATGVVW